MAAGTLPSVGTARSVGRSTQHFLFIYYGKKAICALRASVGSTETSNGHLARVGRIDRSDRLSPFIDSHNALCPGARRYAEAKIFPIGIAHSWSWAIGSSTGAARRSFDVVVSRR